jgi:nucleotide-binding universal stress UspA family protein
MAALRPAGGEMKILATLDGSRSGEAVLDTLVMLGRIPDAEITLFSVTTSGVAARVGGRASSPDAPSPQAQLTDRAGYLRRIADTLPPGVARGVETVSADRAAPAIIQYALRNRPDVIVMATHGETGIVHRIFGDVAEEVVRSGVAPVLLVHPESVRARVARDAPAG